MADPINILLDMESWFRENGCSMFAKKAQEALGAVESLRLAAARADVGAGWQPIETAPKGEKVLLYFPEKRDSRCQVSFEPMHRVDYADAYPNRRPTHWKPLDAPSTVRAQVGAELSAPGVIF